MCLALQKTVDQLKHKVNILSTRVGVLEDELTTANDKILTMRNRIDSIPDESSADETVLSSIHPLDESSQDSDEDIGQHLTPVENVIIPLATAKETKSQVGPSQDNIVNKPESDKPSEEGPTEGFHLSKRDRKKIVQRGQLGKYKKHQNRQSDRSQPGNLKVAPTTSPKQAFKIQAADNEENSLNSLSHIYVGRLSSQENEQKIRVHLHEIGIPLLKVSDVLKLRCKRPRESSFCITINDNSIKDSIYDTANWPAGVIIRAFTPSIQRRSAPAQRSYQNNNRAPRFNNARSRNYGHASQRYSGYNGEDYNSQFPYLDTLERKQNKRRNYDRSENRNYYDSEDYYTSNRPWNYYHGSY